MWWLLSAWVVGTFVCFLSVAEALAGLTVVAAAWLCPRLRIGWRRCLLLCCTGLLVSQFFLTQALNGWLPASLDGHVVTLSGQVTGLPNWRPPADDGPASSQLKLSQVRLVSASADWPGEHLIRLYDYSERRYRPGDTLLLRAKLYRPRGLVNAGSVDWARLNLAYGIDASGSVVEVLKHTPGWAPVDRLREAISQHIRHSLVGFPEAAGLFPALVVGDWRYLSAASWQLYQHAGVAHLVVISGGHLTLVAGMVWLLLRYLCVPLLWWRGSSLSAQQWALLPTLGLTTAYCLLAGWSVSTLRALLMLTVWFLCRLWRRDWPKQRVLALALLVVMLWQPMSPLSNGFWLSFIAVALLLLLVDSRPSLLRLQCLLSLVLGALAAFMFAQWSLLGVLANLLLIPLFSLLILPLALLGSLLPGAGWLLTLVAPVVAYQEEFLRILLAWSPDLLIPAGWWEAAFLMLAVSLWLMRFFPWPRWSLALLLLPWIWPPQAHLAQGAFEVRFFDVGQGQAAVVRTAAGLVLYDMGPSWYGSDAGARVVRPWLRKQRQPVLLAFASHADDDHAGGLNSLRGAIPPGRLLSGEPWQVGHSLACVAGQHWRFSGVDFRVLWPPALVNLSADNDYSCVLRVSGRYGSLLLTGDIPKSVEYWLLAHNKSQLAAKVLQLGHHGSASSSSYAFLRAVAPEAAVASVGYMNHLQHPARVVQDRLAQLGIPLLRTDLDGMLRFSLDGKPPLVWRERQRSWPWEPSSQGLQAELTRQ